MRLITKYQSQSLGGDVFPVCYIGLVDGIARVVAKHRDDNRLSTTEMLGMVLHPDKQIMVTPFDGEDYLYALVNMYPSSMVVYIDAEGPEGEDVPDDFEDVDTTIDLKVPEDWGFSAEEVAALKKRQKEWADANPDPNAETE